MPSRPKFWYGILCCVLAEASYGVNGFGASHLYKYGFATTSVLFYRFSFAAIILLVLLFARREKLLASRRDTAVAFGCGILFAASAITLYSSFKAMDTGLACTLLFVYPLMVVGMMALFFHERVRWVTVCSIALSFVGVALLYWGDGTTTLPLLGVVLVLLSALSYALYIIVVNRSNLQMSSFKINFYVLIYCTLGMLVYSMLADEPLTMPHSFTGWFYVGWLAIVPAIMALVLMVYAAKLVGSTTTAILGALEPLTAVLIGIFVFGEQFTLTLALGILLILASVTLIVLKPSTSSGT